MSDTPMTDDRIVYGTLSGDDSIGAPWVNAPFARQLERELNAANEKIKKLEEAGDELSKWVDRNTPVTIRNDWTAAKEAKP